MAQHTILLIDDSQTLLEILTEYLLMSGYLLLTACDGISGLRLTFEQQPDLVVLDIMMPGIDGWEVCQQIRAMSSVPIIMITGKCEEADKLRGFYLGADDYVTKPFSFAELAARIGAVLSRFTRTVGPVSEQRHTLTRGNLQIDFDQQRILIDQRPVNLTRTEYRLLEMLARHPNRTIATEQLIEAVWGPGYAGEVEQVKHFIWTLRKKIESDPSAPKHLITQRGFGYRFE